MNSVTWKISIRNLLKNRTSTLINILGLSLGFSAFMVIALFIKHELAWDKSNANYDRMYRVQRHYAKTLHAMDGNDISPHSRAITAQLLEKQFPEIDKATVMRENRGKFLASHPEKQVYEESGICADSCYFEVFTYHFLEGRAENALVDPFNIVLSKTMAEKLFRGESALGQTVILEKKFDLKVVGVYADLPDNWTIRPEYIVSFSTLAQTDNITRSNIRSGDCMTFVLLKPGTD